MLLCITNASKDRSVIDVKKKCSDSKQGVKEHVALHWQSICATNGDKGTSEPTHLSEELAGIIRKFPVGGTLMEANGDKDVPG